MEGARKEHLSREQLSSSDRDQSDKASGDEDRGVGMRHGAPSSAPSPEFGLEGASGVDGPHPSSPTGEAGHCRAGRVLQGEDGGAKGPSGEHTEEGGGSASAADTVRDIGKNSDGVGCKVTVGSGSRHTHGDTDSDRDIDRDRDTDRNEDRDKDRDRDRPRGSGHDSPLTPGLAQGSQDSQPMRWGDHPALEVLLQVLLCASLALNIAWGLLVSSGHWDPEGLGPLDPLLQAAAAGTGLALQGEQPSPSFTPLTSPEGLDPLPHAAASGTSSTGSGTASQGGQPLLHDTSLTSASRKRKDASKITSARAAKAGGEEASYAAAVSRLAELGDRDALRWSPLRLSSSSQPALTPQQIEDKLSINGTPCARPELRQLLLHLHNVVLIININYSRVAWKTADLLRAVYGRFFSNVIIVGPEAIPAIGVEARGHLRFRKKWMFAYFHLPAIMARYPSADGFLWTNDDVALNYWNFHSVNTSKLWLPDNGRCGKCRIFVPFKGRARVFDGWSSRPQMKLKAQKALLSLEPKYIRRYSTSMHSRKKGYTKQVVDAFYIPRRHVEALAFDLVPTFRDAIVPSEIAVPMMFHSLEVPKEYDCAFTHITYRWERGPWNPRRWWTADLMAYHHWKLANPNLRRLFLQAYAEVDPCIHILQGVFNSST